MQQVYILDKKFQANEDMEALDEEELEEKRWGKRTQQLLHIINRNLVRGDACGFKDLTMRKNRKQVRGCITLYVLHVIIRERFEVQRVCFPSKESQLGPAYNELVTTSRFLCIKIIGCNVKKLQRASTCNDQFLLHLFTRCKRDPVHNGSNSHKFCFKTLDYAIWSYLVYYPCC